MDKPALTSKRIKIAFVVAVFADALEFPLAWLESFDSSFLIFSGKFLGIMLDCCVMAIMTKLLGLHWVLFPSFCVEAVPKIDMFPTWVAAVAYIVWEDKRSKAQQMQTGSQSPFTPPIINLERPMRFLQNAVRNLTASPPQPLQQPTAPPPIPGDQAIEVSAQTSPSLDDPVGQRLKRLNDLREKNLISQSEYEAKRRQVLDEI